MTGWAIACFAESDRRVTFVLKKMAVGLAAVGLAASLSAQTPPAPPPKPKLIVAISVDQYSSDLFNAYRTQMTGGIKRLMQGVVFPSGFQSHAATETCPGHATILTGAHPARSGIIANDWADPKLNRTGRDGKPDFGVYCAEDVTVPGTNSGAYVVSPVHLKVPTLGDRLKAVSPESRVVSVSGKDRGAVMMGGHKADHTWWWDGKGYVTYRDWKGTPPKAVATVTAAAKAAIARPPVERLPLACNGVNQPVAIEGGTVGTLKPPKAGDARAFRATPTFDRLTMQLAEGALSELKLGQGAATDVLAISLSGTDYTGHSFGTAGGEICAQVHAVDKMLGGLFAKLDASRVPYAVVLTADHGGHDLPERNRELAIPDAKRVGTSPNMQGIDALLATKYKVPQPVLIGAMFGDVYLATTVPVAQRSAVIADAKAAILSHPDVEAVYTQAELTTAAPPSSPPEDWPLISRVRANFDPSRSGDLYVVLKERVTPIPSSGLGYVATHGSVWNYDRRVPILFWQKGLRGFEQPNGVETVDILPTLASLIGLPIPTGEIDGRCLDLIAGAASNCP
jgi:predicted AlkP superfamily pyrophosphatase or phosphodiesterase